MTPPRFSRLLMQFSKPPGRAVSVSDWRSAIPPVAYAHGSPAVDTVDLLDLIRDSAEFLCARNAVTGVKACQDEFDTRRPHRLALARVHLERLLPGLGYAFHSFR